MSTALYRRYRPETFADVIGQEHVTLPLMRALETDRVNHAYLFSGPRGCGKTTSARILARCLNCEQGPTSTPCGTCDSCVALARGGAGTIDVIEIDAASHGGVDDARDLRDRAAYGPASSRYKIYIIDEAHMVTTQGFNALLKVVEEPPPHVKFIFATTEPDKVIGTIRSRTHHYPFHLVPPQRLTDYLGQLCESEQVQVEPGVLSFVTRAGGGSVRDSLSVLDQLISGSDAGGLTYAGAAALLGFTDSELLDATVDALAAVDAAATFRQVGKVIESGHDPRRFVEDLLERLRDLIIVAAVPEGVAQVLRGVPEDQLERMRQQAAAFGAETLTRAATIVNAGLSEMTGATAPRLQLELICARVLLPGAQGEEGYAARLDRVERRLDIEGSSAAAPAQPAAVPPSASSPVATPDRGKPATTERGAPAEPAAPRRVEPDHDATAVRSQGRDIPDRAPDKGVTEEPAENQDSPRRQSAAESTPSGSTPSGSASDGPGTDDRRTDAPTTGSASGASRVGSVDTDAVRRAWPDVLDAIARIRRVTWALLSQHAQVQEYDAPRLVLSLSSAGLASTVERSAHRDVVAQAVHEILGITVTVHAHSDAGAPVDLSSPAGVGHAAEVADVPDRAGDFAPATQTRDVVDESSSAEHSAQPSGPQDANLSHGAGNDPGISSDADSAPARRSSRIPARRRPAPVVEPGGWGASEAPAPGWARGPESPVAAESNGEQDAARQGAPGESPQPVNADYEGDEGSRDDEDVEDAGEVGIPVVASILGGVVIEDHRD